MAQATSIEWTEATLNPWTGCTKVDPACAHCYIEYTPPFRMAGRHFVRGHIPLVFHMERLEKMVRRRKPTLYFVNSLSDLFHEDASDEQIASVFAAMAAAPQHTFQVLTKRQERMRDLLRRTEFIEAVEASVEDYAPAALAMAWPLPNVWMGVTIGNRRFVHRADVLRATPAAVRFISAEPLLGPLIGAPHPCHTCRYGPDGVGVGSVEPSGPARGTGGAMCPDCEGTGTAATSLDLTGIDWVIVGGESGPGHRPMRLEWARDLRDACAASRLRCPHCNGSGAGPQSGAWGALLTSSGVLPAECQNCGGQGHLDGTALFVKQLGGSRPGTALEDLPADLRIREFPIAARETAVPAC